MTAYFALGTAAGGLLLYVLAPLPKIAEIGRILFLCGMLVLLLVLTLFSQNTHVELF